MSTRSGKIVRTAKEGICHPDGTCFYPTTEVPDSGITLDEVLIDVRSLDEYSTGAIEGSLHIPYQEILTDICKVPGLQKNTRIRLYCRSGRRSGIAADELRSAGYLDVLNLGGLEVATEEVARLRGSGGTSISTTDW